MSDTPTNTGAVSRGSVTRTRQGAGNDHPDTRAAAQQPKPCARCGQRPGTELWSATGCTVCDARAGWASCRRYCTQCVVEEQLAFARTCAARIPDLEARLATLPEGQ